MSENKRPTLVLLAAGMASRYGSMKQVQGFGPGNETIMDYSIYDSLRAGFGKVVFIIRREFADSFKAIFDPKLKGRVKTDYVFQEMDSFLDGYEMPADRKKPWGTAHAVLCARDVVSEPFAVINADDFYGRDAFEKAHAFLTRECRSNLYANVGYDLVKTLSEHGSVSRGVCQVDKDGFLAAINERTKLYREEKRIVYEEGDEKYELAADTKVSMNFWCFHPSVFDLSADMFRDFLEQKGQDPKSEFFIPIVADHFIQKGIGKVKLIPTASSWFGVTYKEDAPGVEKSLLNLIRNGEYSERLWD